MRYLKYISWVLLTGCAGSTSSDGEKSIENINPQWALVVHGGAGHFDEESYTDEQENDYRENLQKALDTGAAILADSGTSADAVEATIKILEDCPLFNAGKGAVFTSEGVNEMDASFMDGATLNCGAVTGIQRIKNPISAARKVMTESDHVFFSGAGATQFAIDQGLEVVDSSYFKTEKSWNRYLKAKEKYGAVEDEKRGTVGCVALDLHGNLASGTSTGGMTWKQNGRIGDSPVIAAGTYADNTSCAVSCTGHGEYFIRAVVAHDIAARKQYKQIGLVEAAEEVVMGKLVEMGGEGGIIALDTQGNVAMVFNSAGMFRGYETSAGQSNVSMYGPYQPLIIGVKN